MIFLIGFPGSGKTTLGQAVAVAAGVPFVDLDSEIEARAGKSVAEIFAESGEAAFRRLEADVLADVCRRGDAAVVATGGGTPCQPGLMSLMKSAGLTVRLDASAARIAERLRIYRADRPATAGLDDAAIDCYIERLHRERDEAYAQADAAFDSSLLETEAEIEASANHFIERFLQDATHTA